MKTPGHKIKCVICGGTFEEYGNNARPVAKGVCCDTCNATKVIPERLKRLRMAFQSNQ
ncbi:MAG: hypothetical protein IJ057_10325 [Bacteroidales bacterium]|nr:hypothetical protein [Bacteroidales bacterium]